MEVMITAGKKAYSNIIVRDMDIKREGWKERILICTMLIHSLTDSIFYKEGALFTNSFVFCISWESRLSTWYL